jgi:hypothetical protein
MKTLEQITEALENLDDNELLSLWNEYQSEISGESQVYDFDDEFFEGYFSDPQECGRAVFFGKINSWNDKYIQFNGYGNLESSSYLSEMISVYDLANHIDSNQDNYDTFLETIEEEEEETE